jgi:hypothetical protein
MSMRPPGMRFIPSNNGTRLVGKGSDADAMADLL